MIILEMEVPTSCKACSLCSLNLEEDCYKCSIIGTIFERNLFEKRDNNCPIACYNLKKFVIEELSAYADKAKNLFQFYRIEDILKNFEMGNGAIEDMKEDFRMDLCLKRSLSDDEKFILERVIALIDMYQKVYLLHSLANFSFK